MKVLIIDDEPDTVIFLTVWLEDHGYQTCSASDGEQGMRMLEAEQPDVLLLDLKMPHQTGLQLYRTLRAQPRWQTLPVIIVTGMSSKLSLFSEACGPLPEPDLWLEKPVDLPALHAALKTFAETRR